MLIHIGGAARAGEVCTTSRKFIRTLICMQRRRNYDLKKTLMLKINQLLFDASYVTSGENGSGLGEVFSTIFALVSEPVTSCWEG